MSGVFKGSKETRVAGEEWVRGRVGGNGLRGEGSRGGQTTHCGPSLGPWFASETGAPAGLWAGHGVTWLQCLKAHWMWCEQSGVSGWGGRGKERAWFEGTCNNSGVRRWLPRPQCRSWGHILDVSKVVPTDFAYGLDEGKRGHLLRWERPWV